MTAWPDRFPALQGLDVPVRARLIGAAQVMHVPEGTAVFGPGQPAQNMLLLLKGRVRVQHTSEGGRDIVLYRVHAGESCVLTTACLLAYEDYTAEGVAETDLEAVAIPRAAFDAAMAASSAFRRFVFTAYAQRITDLFLTVEEIAFGRMDVRLAHKLLELGAEGDTIAATHGMIATELGTAREVVSRQLAEFQRRGWIGQRRGAVDLADRAALRAFAAAHPV